MTGLISGVSCTVEGGVSEQVAYVICDDCFRLAILFSPKLFLFAAKLGRREGERREKGGKWRGGGREERRAREMEARRVGKGEGDGGEGRGEKGEGDGVEGRIEKVEGDGEEGRRERGEKGEGDGEEGRGEKGEGDGGEERERDRESNFMQMQW